jgi:WD40 repeat-containing protein SMU1
MAPPSRLITIIDQAMRWQNYQGHIPQCMSFDLLSGTARTQIDEIEFIPTEMDKKIDLGGKKFHPECMCFSPDGLIMVIGSIDGFLEVRDALTGKVKKDLNYQKTEHFMMHGTAVLCLTFSKDSELLVSGSEDGDIKVWKIRTGKCIRELEKAHPQGVTTVALSNDGTLILSGSFLATLRVHGIKSGKLLKEFHGHSSYINCAIYSISELQIISASSDATVQVWDVRTCECLTTMRLPKNLNGFEVPINDIQFLPPSFDQIVVCNRSNTIYIMNIQGLVIKSFQSGKRELGDFLGCRVSPRGNFIYCLGEDSIIYCFSVSSGKLEHSIQAHEYGVIGLRHHPHRNQLTIWTEDGCIKNWVVSKHN